MQLTFNVASCVSQLFHYYFVYLISQQFHSNDTFYGCSSFHIVIAVVLIGLVLNAPTAIIITWWIVIAAILMCELMTKI